MKQKIFSLFMLLMLVAATSFAQETGIYNLTEAGTLKDIPNISTVTHLTLTGFIDARDTKFMRDNMPALANLDLSNATIMAYEGDKGTLYDEWISYPANEIPTNAFYFADTQTGKTSLKNIEFPASLPAIATNAFRNTGLTEIYLPSDLIAIGDSAFMACFNLTWLDLPNQLLAIGDYAFAYCYDLEGDLELPLSLFELGKSAFYDCYKISGDIIISPQITEIKDGVFFNCFELTSVTFATHSAYSGIHSIGDHSFFSCEKITNIEIPSTVTSIGKNAFAASGLSSNMIIPNSVSFIGSNAFAYTDLDTVFCQSGVPAVLGYYYNEETDSYYYGAFDDEITIIVPCGVLNVYQNADIWRDYENMYENCPSATQKVSSDLSITPYPNPAQDRIFIQSDIMVKRVEIYSLTGKLLISEDNFIEKISISALSQGVYLLKIYTDKGLVVRKIEKD
ncbi:MAG: leucine-rich repeat protein [Tannerellaceae bacterium]|nr:leucine-rich repeat protein [Tannerellaceae bacterium]